eukprot:TRINITY_DN31974_c0_g1_i1.p2 TRINITY_DN31974_c0_g1~~TRINITY_DN31974_c0_g1_i1.p2  ORF type:complete len:267 (-),score=101.38 TRINITY_DN31974_c0_g1_i1:641-1441(-)
MADFMDLVGIPLKREAAAADAQNADGSAAKAPRTTKDGGKGNKGAKGSKKDRTEELVQLVAKLSLGCARDVSMLKSMFISCVLYSRETQLMKDILKHTKGITERYQLDTKDLSNTNKKLQGSPHTLVWFGLLNIYQEWLQAQPEDMADKQNILKILLEHSQDIKNRAADITKETHKSLETEDAKETLKLQIRYLIAKDVKVCRFSNTWNPKQGRFELFSTTGTSAGKLTYHITQFLAKVGDGEIKHTMAPRSDIERRILAIVTADK